VGLEAIVIQHLTVARIAKGVALSCNTATTRAVTGLARRGC